MKIAREQFTTWADFFIGLQLYVLGIVSGVATAYLCGVV